MTTTEIEKRLAALEAEVANLKAAPKQKNQWWNKIAGVFENNPKFEEAMRFGREWRKSEDRKPVRRTKKSTAKKGRK